MIGRRPRSERAGRSKQKNHASTYLIFLESKNGLELHSAFQFDLQSNRRASTRSNVGVQIHSIMHRLFEGFFRTRGDK